MQTVDLYQRRISEPDGRKCEQFLNQFVSQEEHNEERMSAETPNYKFRSRHAVHVTFEGFEDKNMPSIKVCDQLRSRNKRQVVHGPRIFHFL